MRVARSGKVSVFLCPSRSMEPKENGEMSLTPATAARSVSNDGRQAAIHQDTQGAANFGDHRMVMQPGMDPGKAVGGTAGSIGITKRHAGDGQVPRFNTSPTHRIR